LRLIVVVVFVVIAGWFFGALVGVYFGCNFTMRQLQSEIGIQRNTCMLLFAYF